MAIEIVPVETGDWVEITRFGYLAWKGEVLWTNVLGEDTPENQERAATAFATRRNGEAHMKAVDSETGAIMGYVGWAFFDKDPFVGGFEAVQSPNLSGLHREYVEWYRNSWIRIRSEMPELRRAHCHLHELFTNPEFGKRGVGSKLVAWGCEIADEKNLPCVLESTIAGHKSGVYHRFGFEDVRHYVWADADKYPGKTAKTTLMYRPSLTERTSKRQDQS